MPTSIWNRLMVAVRGASQWEGVDRERLIDLEGAVREVAQGHLSRLDPADARDLLAILEDGRAARYFISRRVGAAGAPLQGLRSLLKARIYQATQPSPLRRLTDPSVAPQASHPLADEAIHITTDRMALMEAQYPLPKGMPPARARLTRLFRRAIIRQTQGGTLRSLVREKGFRGDYFKISRGFAGRLPVKGSALEFYRDIILRSNVVDRDQVEEVFRQYLEEQVELGRWSVDADPLDLEKRRVSFEEWVRKEGPVWDLEEWMKAQALSRETRAVLSTLTSKEEKVLKMRFGFFDERGEMTLEEVGREFGVKGERARQIEARALRKLGRHPSRSKRLAPYLRDDWHLPRSREISAEAMDRGMAVARLDDRAKMVSTGIEIHKRRAQSALTRLALVVGDGQLSKDYFQTFEKLFEGVEALNQEVGTQPIRIQTAYPVLLSDLETELQWMRLDQEASWRDPIVFSRGWNTMVDLWWLAGEIFEKALPGSWRVNDCPPNRLQRTSSAALELWRILADRHRALNKVGDGPRGEVYQKTWELTIAPKRRPGGRLYSGLAALEEGWEIGRDWVGEWWESSRGETYPASHENLVRFGLTEPATVRGRLVRYGLAEGIPGLVSIFAAPYVTQSILGINPHRRPGEFHIINLGALHLLNAAGGALSDVLLQMGRGVSAIQVGNRVVASPSLARTFLRGFAHRTGTVAGLAEGVVWAYPGYVVGEGATGLVTENPAAKAIGGGAGAVGLPLGLRIWLGREGVARLAGSMLGRLAGPAGASVLVNDLVIGVHESSLRRGMREEEIAQREKAIEETPWLDRFIANLMIFFSIAGYDASNPFTPQFTLEDALAKRDQMIAKK